MERGSFARVVQRQGWDVEIIDVATQAEPVTRDFDSREVALAFAEAQEPSWIEVGVVVYATAETPQHHEWQTLRRGADGKYRSSPLVWSGGTRTGGAEASRTKD